MGKISSTSLKIKGAVRKALEYLDSKTGAEGEVMLYKGTGDALPSNPEKGWVFKVNATSAEVDGAPSSAADKDLIIYNGKAWQFLVK